MRYLGIALAISFGMGMALFAAVYPIFHDSHLAAGIAAMPIAGCHHIAEMLERRETRASVAAHRITEIHSLAGFTVAWPLVIACATIALLGIILFATTFSAAVMTFMVGADGEFSRTQTIAMMLIAAPVELVGGFAVGRWIGSRCARWSAAATLLVAGLAVLIANGLGAWLESLLGGSAPVLGSTPLREIIIETLVGFSIFAVAGLFGRRQGRKRRLAEYMDYLLSVLPAPTRGVLVELAFDEARKAGSAVAPAEPAMRQAA